MQTVALDAYLCDNLGDDLMVRAALDRLPWTTFLVSEGSLTAFPADRVVRTGPRDRMTADAYLVLGGSMFMDRRGRDLMTWQRHRRQWTRRVATAAWFRLRGRPVLVVGCNLGPVETTVGRVLLHGLVRLSTAVTVRDTASWAAADAMSPARLSYAPDLVLAAADLDAVRDLPRQPVLAVAPVQVGADLVDDYARAMTRRCTELVREHGLSTVSVVGLHGAGADDEVVGRIRAGLEEAGVPCRSTVYDGDVEAALRELGSASVVVASRLHAAVLALALGQPLEVVSYSRKIDNTLGDLDLSLPVHALTDVPTGPSTATAPPAERVRAVAQQAREHLRQAEDALARAGGPRRATVAGPRRGVHAALVRAVAALL